MSKNDPFFEILTPLNCTICVTVTYWEIITQIKHPIMKGQEKLVQETLSQPDEIRRSRSDPNVYLYLCEETGDEVILMKNQKGEVIGFEKLNYRISENRNLKISLETATPL